MTLLYDHPCFLEHETGDHPERAERLRRIGQRLRQAGLAQKCRRAEFKPCDRRRLARVHSPAYIDGLWTFAKSGGGYIEDDTIVSPGSYFVAMQAVAAACDATERVVRGEDTQALCLVRPPGHHAMSNAAMGFCLLNNVAVAAKTAIDELGLDRVLIVDWDVHHGNGTQAAFWEEPRVGFLSIHRWPFYPGTGAGNETGGGRGLGTTLNLPVQVGTSRKDYISLFAYRLERFAAKIKPQLIFVSAGFDAHRKDPEGDLGLESEDFIALTDLVLDAAAAHCNGRVISVLEGGYHLEMLAECVELHLREMLDRQGEK
jgi:acetoin utilization deacetylase AcuC-like enzyme